jgi:hypothetical protein
VGWGIGIDNFVRALSSSSCWSCATEARADDDPRKVVLDWLVRGSGAAYVGMVSPRKLGTCDHFFLEVFSWRW